MPTNIGPVIGVDGEKEYRKQINQIIQQAKTLDAEMKAVTSSFDGQNDSQKKLTAQSESLTKQIENQEKRIDLLQQMTDKAAQKYGEADTRTLKWRQAVADATTALNQMRSNLSQVNQELEENASASGTSHLERLTGVIQDQERELEELKVAYQEAVLAKGRDSQEAQDAARKIQSLSTDLKENKTDMQQLAREADSLAGELDDAGNSADKASGGFTVMKGALADLASSGIQSALGGIKDMATSVLDLGEATQEHRSMMLKMQGSAQAFGYEMEFVTEQYQNFYRYLGDDQMAVNAITNLTGMRVSTETVSQAAEAAIAVWASYGDSIPIESLTESINESSQVAQVTGVLADALNWAGISEDEFNIKLQSLSSTQERADLIAQTLNDTYGESKDWYDENAKSMLDTNDAQRELMDTQSDMAEDVDNLNVELDRLKTDALEAMMPVIEDVVGAISDAVNWFNNLDDGTKDMITTIGKIAVVAVPTVTAIGKIGSAVSGAKKLIDSFKTSTEAASTAMQAVDTASEGASGKISGFGGVLSTVGGAAGIVGIATGALLGLGAALDEAWKNDQIDRWSNFASGAQTFVEAMQNADASLEGFDLTLFASAEKQQALADNMQTIQTRITEICQTASSERRGYTQGEVTELETLFTQLSELTEQTYSAYTAQIQAIETQAVDAAGQAGQVGINEYIQLANDWTAKATAAYQEQTQAIEESKTQQLTLLNQQYTTEAARQTQAYQDEYNRIVNQADERLRLAQESVANVTSAYMQGMEQYVDIQDLMQQKTSWHNQSLQEIQQNHANMMIAIQQQFAGDEEALQGAMERENADYANAIATAWTDLAEGMDKSQADALAAYLGMATYTETYGGEISATTRSMVTGIIQSVDMLPDEVKTPIQDMMGTLKNTMQTQAPDLWAAATDIGSGIANAISRFVHFSRPDEGPLRYYDRWMPDFAKGLARSAQKSLPTVRKIGDDMAKALTLTLPDYSKQVRAAMEQMDRVEQQAQIYSDLQSDGITVNWDGSPADYPASTIQITVNAAPGQSEEQIADAVAYRLQHQVQQQRRGRL